jgi:hypothetical protein
MSQRSLDLDVFFGKMTKARKMDMRFDTWNVRNLYRTGSRDSCKGNIKIQVSGGHIG